MPLRAAPAAAPKLGALSGRDRVEACEPRPSRQSPDTCLRPAVVTMRRVLAAVLLVLLVCGAAQAQGEQAGEQAAGEPIRLEVAAEPADPYVQARVRYRVRILTAVPLRRPTLSDPAVEDATLTRIGKDRQWTERRDGLRYTVWERLYAIVPLQVGELRIAGPRLSAAVPRPSAANDSAAGRPGLIETLDSVHRQARDLVLNVRPPPPAAGAPWLPAESVSISEQWSAAGPEQHLGVPLVRTVHIEASGVRASQLPDLPTASGEGFKVYPGQPTLSEQVSGEDLLATKSIEISYVPKAPGAWQVPPLELPWWSLGMDEPRQLRLPARTVQVVGDSPASDRRGGAGADAQVRQRFAEAAADDHWRGPWLSALLALGWLTTLVLWWLDRRTRPPRPEGPAISETADSNLDLDGALRRFERACQADDSRAARAALLAWGSARWPEHPPRGPEQLLARIGADEDARMQLRLLEQHLYGDEGATTTAWDGSTTLSRLRPHLIDAADPGPKQGLSLPPLYHR
jgi:hypothetical protein